MECPFASYAHCNVFSNYKWGSVGGATHIHVHAPPQGIMQASPQLQEFHMSHNSWAQHLMEAVRTPSPPQPHMGSNTVYMPSVQALRRHRPAQNAYTSVTSVKGLVTVALLQDS